MSFISKSDDLIKLDDLTESKNHFKLFESDFDKFMIEMKNKNIEEES